MKILYLFLFFFIVLETKADDFYLIKTKDSPKPFIIKSKEYKENTISYIDKKTNKEIILKIKDLEYIKEYINNGTELFGRAILLTNQKYVIGYLVSQNTKKIVIESPYQNDLLVYKSNEIEHLLSIENFYKEKNKTALKAALWSAVFPGLGQSYGNQNEHKAYILGTAFLISAFQFANYYSRSNSDYSSYQSSFYFDRGAFSNYQQNVSIANIFGAIAIGIWSYGIIDSYLLFKPKFKHENLFQGENREIIIEIEKKF